MGKTLPSGVLPVAVAEEVSQAPSRHHCVTLHIRGDGAKNSESGRGKSQVGWRQARHRRISLQEIRSGFPGCSSLTNDSAGVLHVCVSTCVLVGGELSEGRGGRRLPCNFIHSLLESSTTTVQASAAADGLIATCI